MAVLLRSPAVQSALQRLAPASAAAASRLFFSNSAAAASRRNNSDDDDDDDDVRAVAGVPKLKAEAYLARLLRQSTTQSGGPKRIPTNVVDDEDARIEQAREELLQLYLRRKPPVGAAAVEADLARLLRQFEARSQQQQQHTSAAASISMVKDDGSDWRDSVESMEPEEFSTEAYEGEPDCVSGYCFSGGSYTPDSYSGDMFWEKEKDTRPDS